MTKKPTKKQQQALVNALANPESVKEAIGELSWGTWLPKQIRIRVQVPDIDYNGTTITPRGFVHDVKAAIATYEVTNIHLEEGEWKYTALVCEHKITLDRPVRGLRHKGPFNIDYVLRNHKEWFEETVLSKLKNKIKQAAHRHLNKKFSGFAPLPNYVCLNQIYREIESGDGYYEIDLKRDDPANYDTSEVSVELYWFDPNR